MRVLLTNDDGIEAEGIEALEEALRALGRVTVVAPAKPRSAVSQSITLHKPIVVHGAGRSRYAVEGTPTDCVKLALKELCRSRPELVVSGINRGLNTGADILYSGTVAGAFEGSLQGIPSVAVSLELSKRMRYDAAARLAVQIIRQLEGRHGAVYNINVPAKKVKGVKVTRQGGLGYRDSFRRRSDPRGRPYYWLESVNGRPPARDPARNGVWTDQQAVSHGYVSVTPLKRDLTAEGHLDLDLS